MPDTIAPDAPRLAEVPRAARPLHGLRLLRAVLRNAVEAVPPGCYTEPMVVQEFLGRPRIFLQDPDLIQRVMLTEADAFAKSDSMRRALGPALGEGILTAHGEHWRWQRRAVAPIFRHDRLRGMVNAMREAAERRRDAWLALPSGSTVDAASEMMRTTFDIIEATMLSGRDTIEPARVEHCIAEYVESTGWSIALAMARAPDWVPYPGRRRAARAKDYLRAELLRLAAERRRRDGERDDLIALLLAARDPETGHAMADRDIADNLLTFIAAGHETTALALTWALYLLALHPRAEARALEEIAAVTGGRPPTAEELDAMPFLRAVLQEAMRLYPPVPYISRSALRDVDLGPLTVPAGAPVYFPVYAIHRHALLWTDPDRFDPDRFLPEAARRRHRFAYLPFGGGPRSCIGMIFAMLEATAILATLLPAVRLCPEPGSTPRLRMRITLRPHPGMPMRVERRGA